MSELKLLREFLARRDYQSNELDSPSVKLKVGLCDAICAMAERGVPRGLAPTRSAVAAVIAEKIKLIGMEDRHDVDFIRPFSYNASRDVIDRQHAFFQLGFLVRLASTFDIKINVETPL